VIRFLTRQGSGPGHRRALRARQSRNARRRLSWRWRRCNRRQEPAWLPPLCV